MKINKVSFSARLTPEIAQQIKNTNLLAISDSFAKRGIPTNFQGNKIIAWCCNKTMEILEHINKVFGQKLALPKGIYVEDFTKMKVPDCNMYGFCNLQPTELINGSGKIIQSRVIFFNSLKNIADKNNGLSDWNCINGLSDKRYAARQSSTNHFLDIFLHEFIHAAHEDRLLGKIGGKKLMKLINLVEDKGYISKYQSKYGKKISQICDYALSNPFEAVACDMSRVVTNSLNSKTLMPDRNPFIGTPYEKLSFWDRIKLPNHSTEKQPLTEILMNFWNGKFE